MDTSEKRFESDIEKYLITHGYHQFSYQDEHGHWIYRHNYDIEKAIYLDVLVEFIEKTQPKEWTKYKKYYGDDAPNKLYRRFEDCVNNEGLIHVLRHGIKDLGISLNMLFQTRI